MGHRNDAVIDGLEMVESGKIYRAYRQPSWAEKNGKPKPKAFFRRPEEIGLSVSFSKEQAGAQIVAAGFCYLLAEKVIVCESDSLRIARDRIDHAHILGVPLKAEDEERAHRIARYLARIAEAAP